MAKSPITRMVVHDVERIPVQLEPGVLYVSREFETAAHLCCCGCGTKTVTPLGPGRWRLTSEGDKPTLYPSVGNTAFPCRSHYFIGHGQVRWAGELSDAAHEAAIDADIAAVTDALHLKPSIWQSAKTWLTRVFRLHR